MIKQYYGGVEEYVGQQKSPCNERPGIPPKSVERNKCMVVTTSRCINPTSSNQIERTSEVKWKIF